jgi:hypothetical protein
MVADRVYAYGRYQKRNRGNDVQSEWMQPPLEPTKTPGSRSLDLQQQFARLPHQFSQLSALNNGFARIAVAK